MFASNGLVSLNIKKSVTYSEPLDQNLFFLKFTDHDSYMCYCRLILCICVNFKNAFYGNK